MTDIHYNEKYPNQADFIKLFETTGWNKSYQASESELITAINNSWYLCCAYHQKQLVGIGRMVSDGVLYAMIYDLIVHPKFQNRGIGSHLLNQLLTKAQSENIRSIQLFSAKGKVDYYQKRGFVIRPNDAPGMVFSP